MRPQSPIGNWTAGLLAMSALAIIGLGSPSRTPSDDGNSKSQLRPAKTSVASVPLYFEPNLGQAAPGVRFVANGNRATLYLTNTGMIFTQRQERAPNRVSWIRMGLVGANPAAEMVGEEEMPGRSNYFVGNDPARWRTDIPHYARVRYGDVYPGVDLVLYDSGEGLEYDFILAPGAELSSVRLQFDGIDGLELSATGNLVLRAGTSQLVQRVPLIYQEADGARTRIEGRYVLLAQNQVGFQIGEYDRTLPLVVDPVVEYARFFGGSKEDEILSLAVDADENAYLTGETSSPDWQLTSGALAHNPAAFQTEGNTLAFVAKVDPSGQRLLYCTYLGGSKTAVGHNIKVDAAGNAYIGGRTEASDFPLKNPLQARFGGGSDDGFVAKLNAAGNALVYSTYIGGSEYDQVRALAVDAAGNAYLTGITESSDFPTRNPLQSKHAGRQDAFAVKVNAAGTAVVYSTYLGGSGNDVGHAIAVDAGGNAYLTGLSNSPNFPTQNALQSSFRGGEGNDAIVVKVNAAGNALLYSTYVGGSKNEESRAIAVDGAGNATITGYTQSADFPTAKPLQAGFAGGSNDIFVSQFSADGRVLRFSTYLGGSGGDYGRGLALDAAGSIYLTGYTESHDFPTRNPFQANYAGGPADTIAVQLNPLGPVLVFSSYLGGSAYERGRGIAVDRRGGIYISGRTESRDFPVTQSLTSRYGGGPNDAYLVKLSSR